MKAPMASLKGIESRIGCDAIKKGNLTLFFGRLIACIGSTPSPRSGIVADAEWIATFSD